MKRIEIDGGNAARVQDAAVDDVRLPHDFPGSSGDTADKWNLFLRDEDGGTITLDEYWRIRESDKDVPADKVPGVPRPTPYFPPDPLCAALDDFTIDAEIIVARGGRSIWSTADIAPLVGVAERTVWRWFNQSKIPTPRFPSYRASSGENVPHRWTSLQVVEIVAAHRRKAAAA